MVVWSGAGMDEDLRGLAALATSQHNTLTRAQIAAAGLSRGALRRLVRNGVLERVGVATYASPFGPSSALHRLADLMFDIGGDVVASGPTAGALHSFDGFKLAPPFHVTVGRGRNVHRAAHRIHTTLDLPLIDRATVLGLPSLSATRALIDLARHFDTARLTVALDSALRDGLTAEHALHRRIVALRSSGRYGIPALIAAVEGVEAIRGGHSWLERRFLELCAAARIPRPRTQAELTRTHRHLVRVDCWFERTPVVVELLGYRWHRTAAQMSRDAERSNALVLAGHLPLQFTYEQVTTEPDRVIAEVASSVLRFV